MYIAYASGKTESAIALLVPLGVLISAALASTSVMKSIHNTNKIEKAKNAEFAKINSFLEIRFRLYADGNVPSNYQIKRSKKKSGNGKRKSALN